MTEEAQAAIYWNKIYEKSQVNKAGVEPLNLTKLTINETGFLHLVFNKPIIRPPLKAVWKGERLLSQYRQFNISEVIDLSVYSDNSGNSSSLESLISDYELLEMSQLSLKIQIYFKIPDEITENLLDPDQLFIRFKLGKAFIDEEDFMRLEEEFKLKVTLPQQFSLTDYAELESSAERVATATKTFSIMSFLICLALGQGLKYIWNIVNVLQFTIFMLRWGVELPLKTKKYLSTIK